MAISLKEFILATKAEVVGGQLIVGERGDRKFVGTAEGTFTLNEAGQAIASEIEAGTYGVAVEPVAVVPVAVVPVAVVPAAKTAVKK